LTVKFKTPKPAEIPSLEEEAVAPQFTQTLNCRNGVSEEKLIVFLKRFCVEYWGLDANGFQPELDLVDDIERAWLAKWDEVSVEEVRYGRIGINKNGGGGISDRGLVSFLFLQELTDAMGLDIDGEDATGLFELETLQDIIDTFVAILIDKSPST